MINRCDKLALAMANYIVQNNATIRQTAKEFLVPKSTAHYLIKKYVSYRNFQDYALLVELLKSNYLQKHIKGGIATKNKYKNGR